MASPFEGIPKTSRTSADLKSQNRRVSRGRANRSETSKSPKAGRSRILPTKTAPAPRTDGFFPFFFRPQKSIVMSKLRGSIEFSYCHFCELEADQWQWVHHDCRSRSSPRAPGAKVKRGLELPWVSFMSRGYDICGARRSSMGGGSKVLREAARLRGASPLSVELRDAIPS